MAKDIVIGGSTYYGATYLQVKTTTGEDAVFTDADNTTFWNPTVTSSIVVGEILDIEISGSNVDVQMSPVSIAIA